MSEKIIIPIVGMRFSKVFKGLTKDEATKKSEELLEGISKGERVVLMAENDNPHDPLAVISYMKGDFYGWVKAAQKNIVRLLMKDEQVVASYVCGSHVTYFVEIETEGPLELHWEKLYSMDTCPLNDRIVTSMPLDERRIAAEESEFRRLLAEVKRANLSSTEGCSCGDLDSVEGCSCGDLHSAEVSSCSDLHSMKVTSCSDLDSVEVTKLREAFMDCAERMVESLGCSLSRESELTMSYVATSLMMLVADPKSKEWGGEKLEQLAEKAERKAADTTRDTGEAIFNTMLDSALNDTVMFERYEHSKGCAIGKMKVAQRRKCAGELKEWLRTMTSLYDLLTPLEDKNWKELAAQIRYLALARTDLYRVMAAIALVKKLEDSGVKSAYKGRKEETLFTTEEECRKKAEEMKALLGDKAKIGLDTSAENPLSCAVVDIVKKKWKVANPNTPALIRFLTQYCGIELKKQEKSVSNKLRDLFR